MQIFWTDNFNRETVSERVVASNISDRGEADIMLRALQNKCNSNGGNWYRLAEDTATPYTFET